MPCEQDALARAAVGNEQDGIAFLRSVEIVSQTWDDLIDRDQPVADARIHEAFLHALVILPENRFYRANVATLQPLLVNSIRNWRIATRLEREQARPDDAAIAFILRSSYADLVVECARITGGDDFAVDLGTRFRRHVHDEGFAGYVDALLAEARARVS